MDAQLFDNPNMLVAAGVVGGILLVYAALYWNKASHLGRHGAPCYCKKCENNLVNAANNGDPVAQQKLLDAQVEGGVYKGESALAGLVKGPFANVLGFAFLAGVLFVVWRFAQASKKYTGRVEDVFTGGLRGR